MSPGFASTQLVNFQGTDTIEDAAREILRVARLGPDGARGTFTTWEEVGAVAAQIPILTPPRTPRARVSVTSMPPSSSCRRTQLCGEFRLQDLDVPVKRVMRSCSF